jgi:hypothetical protein
MRITIIRDDGVVGVAGIFRPVDLSALPAGIRAVQWNGTSGHIEYDGAANTILDSITDFKPFIELWTAATSQSSVPPAPSALPSGNQMKMAVLARIDAAYQAAIDAMSADYPLGEVGSWPKQEAEANAWTLDSNAATPWLDSAAAGRGMSKAELAAKIVANAALFVPAHGRLTGKRQKLRDQVAALGHPATQEQLDAIQW